jgi:hypothetical protein
VAVSKPAAQKFCWEIFNLRKLYELKFRKGYQIENSNRFAVLENFSGSEDKIGIGRTLKRITKHLLKITYFCTN